MFLGCNFSIFAPKLSPKGVLKIAGFAAFWRPRSSQDAPRTPPRRTSTFYRFSIDLGSHVGRNVAVLVTIFGVIVAGSPFSPIPKYLTTNVDSPVSPRGAAVTPRVYNDLRGPFSHRFFDFFSKMAKV